MTTQILTKRNVAAIGEEITQDLGAQFIKDYQKANPNDVKAYIIGKDIISQILAQPGCEGIQFYNAVNEFGQKTLVYVGLNAEGKEMVNYSVINNEGALTIKNGLIGDRAGTQPASDDTDWWWAFD